MAKDDLYDITPKDRNTLQLLIQKETVCVSRFIQTV
jgi:hypothetical protein